MTALPPPIPLDDKYREVEFFGQTIDVVREVSIPRDVPLDDLLYDHPNRVMIWGRIYAKCIGARTRAIDALEEVRAECFRHYWDALEEQERKELHDHLTDEQDAADPFKPSTAKIAKARAAAGPIKIVPRWRRNFSDDRVWGFVNYDERVIAARKVLADAKAKAEIAKAVVDALDARGRSLSHLCAIHRDGRAG